MSRTIDSKVVEMRFDNKQFESGVKQTMSTLDKLKAALKFTDASKGLENLGRVTKDVKFDGLAAGIDKLNQKFSTFGVAWMRIVSNVTDALQNRLHRAVSSVTDAIVSGGIKRAMNIENAHFQLQSILNDEERVQAVMKSANDSVSGTAYSFDVAAKAASMFTASGIKDTESLDSALKALAGTTATFNADYESMAMIFTQVAGQGRLMGDQLLQLSTRGANAAVTIANFVNGVNSGSINVTESVRAAVKNISTATDVTEADIRDVVSEGKVNFEAFAAAMDWAFGDSAKKANETFNGALANIKAALARIGAGFVSPLVAQNSEIVRLFNAVREKVNDIKTSLVFDEEIGNVHALSKQFSDSVLTMAGSLADFVSKTNLTKPLAIFYNSVETVKNVLKGLYSILKPIGKAFLDVFSGFKIDGVVNFTLALAQLTQKLTLSKTASQNVGRAFKGMFSVAKMLIDVVLRLVSAITPMDVSLDGLGEGFLEVAGNVGDMLTAFSEWVRTSPSVERAFGVVSSVSEVVTKVISEAAKAIVDFVSKAKDLPIVQGIFSKIGDTIKGFGKLGLGAIEGIISIVKSLIDSFKGLDASKPNETFEKIGASIKKLTETVKGAEDFKTFTGSIKDFLSELVKAFSIENISDKIASIINSIGKFVDFMKDVGSKLFSNFSIGGAVAAGSGVGIIYSMVKVAKSLEGLTKSIKSIPDTFGAVRGALEAWQRNMDADTIMKIAKAIAVLCASLLLLSFADQTKLSQAAKSLALVGGTLTIGFAALTKAMNEAKKIKNAADAARNATETANKLIKPLDTLAKGLSKGIDNITKAIGKAITIKAMGSAFKKFAQSIVMIVGSIIVIAIAYRKDPEAVKTAGIMVGIIAAALTAIMGLGSILGQFAGTGMKNFSKGASAVRSIASAILIIVVALEKLFKMQLPPPVQLIVKMGLLASILMAVAALTLTVGVASRLAGNGKISGGPIIAAAAMIYVVVLALERLMAIEIGNDWIAKLGMMALMFGGVAGVILALGVAGGLSNGKIKMAGTLLALTVMIIAITKSLETLSKIPFLSLLGSVVMMEAMFVGICAMIVALGAATKLANGQIKMAGTLLALSVMIIAITGSLKTLSKIPVLQLGKAVVAMEMVFIGLAGLIVAVGKASQLAGGQLKAAGTLIAMAVLIGTVATSLMVLSLIKWDDLLTAAISLGLVLVALGKALEGAGKISDQNTWKSVLAMAVMVGAITAALGVLSMIPFDSLLTSAGSLGAVLFAVAAALDGAGKVSTGIQVGAIVAMIAAVAVIAASLYALSNQPWDSMLAAGGAITAVLLAFAGVFAVVRTIKPDMSGMAVLLAATLALVPIGIALYQLSKQPWQGLLAAATSIDMVLGGLAGVMAVCAAVGPVASAAIKGIGVLDLVIADLALVLAAAGGLSKIPGVQELISGGAQLLTQIGQAIGDFVGAIINGVLTGISSALPQIGSDISAFMVNLTPFLVGSKLVTADTVKAAGYLAATILIMAGAELVGALGSILGMSFAQYGTELSSFMIAIGPFLLGLGQIKPEMVDAATNLAKMILAVTVADVITGITNFIGLSGNLESFGEELSKFGPYLKRFADSIDGINEGSVTTAVNAATMMSELAKNLPASDTLTEKIFGGGNSLTTFGTELVKFGPLIAKFADQVAGINAGAINGVVTITTVMTNLANNLPDSPTLAQKIFGGGQYSLSTFGAELVQFGPLISQFSGQIAGINAGAVSGVSVITTVMTNLANNLPNTPTLVQKIFGGGSYTLTKFGEELVKFGPLIKQFATQVSGINAGAVSGVSVITTVMTNLANNLPSSDTLWQKLFGGGDSISGFGKELVKFGEYMAEFADKVAGLSLGKLQPAVDGFKALTDLAKYMEHSSATGIVEFAKNLSKVGEDSVESFTKAFTNADSKVKPAISSFFKSVSRIFESEAKSASKDMEKVGAYFIDGMNNGLTKNLSKLQATAKKIGETVDGALCKTLEIHSPSKKGEKRGEQYGEGVVKGGEAKIKDAAGVGKKLGDAVHDATKESLNLEDVYKVYGDQLQPIIKETEQATEKVEEIQNQQEKNNAEHVTKAKAHTKALAQNQQVALAQEQDFWTQLLTIRKTGQDAEKYQDMDMKAFQEDVLKSATDIYQNYVDQYKSAVDSMVSSMDIFSEMEEKEVKSKQELQNILRGQINEYEEYTETLSSLNERLDGTALIEYLRTLGVESTDQLKVMNSMSDTELSNYSDLYDQKLAAATAAADAQMVGLREQTEQNLNELFGSMYSSVDLFDFGAVFDGSLQSLNQYLSDIFIPLEESAAKAEQDAMNISNAIVQGMAGGFSASDAQEILGHPLSALLDSTLTSQLEAIADPSKNIGTNITSGISEGMTSDTSGIDASSMQVMQEILTCLQSAGEIASPSGLMKREVGAFITEGIALGMTENTESLNTAADGIMQTIVGLFTEVAPQMSDAGLSIATSLGTGIEQNSGLASNAALSMSQNVVTTVQSTLNGTVLTPQGENVVQSMINGITSKIGLVTSTAGNLCTDLINKFKNSLPMATFKTFGNNVVQWKINGMTEKRGSLLTTVFNICTEMINKFRTTLVPNTFKQFGINIILWIIEGLGSQNDPLVAKIVEVCSLIITTFTNELDQSKFVPIGENAAMGLAIGIGNKVRDIANAAIAAARAAVERAKNELDEASPSKKFIKMGEYASLGLAIGIENGIADVDTASAKMANKAIDSMGAAIDSINDVINSSSFTTEPVITPVVDLSGVHRSANEINSLMNRTFDLGILSDYANSTASTFAHSRSAFGEDENRSDQNDKKTEYNFVQNNYSPKALTRSEIYRQTNNQFSMFRKAVNPA